MHIGLIDILRHCVNTVSPWQGRLREPRLQKAQSLILERQLCPSASSESDAERKQKSMTMKTMTCKDLGGACDLKFQAETFEEMAEMSKNHGMEMFQQGDEAHLDAMKKMQELMKKPEAMNEWFESRRSAFEALPED